MVDELIVGAAVASSVVGTALINKVSEAVGGIARPYQMKRVAKAEAERALILAQSEIEVTERQRRAAFRWLEEQTKNQGNIESITHQALPHLNDDAEPEKIEDDFLRNFFDKSRLVSDEQMQDVWSRILAGEANNPGTFSRKTINILGDMDKKDAELFTQLCRFVWTFPTDVEPIVYSHRDLWNQHGLTFSSLTDLVSLGLIRTEAGLFGGLTTEELPQSFTATYADQKVRISFSESSTGRVGIGEVAFTSAGRQMYSIVDCAPVAGLFDFMCDKWREASNIESVKVLDTNSDLTVGILPQLREAVPDTEEALLTGWLKEVERQNGTAKLYDAVGGQVSLHFDSAQAEEIHRLAGNFVEVRGSGRFNDQDEWTTVRVEQLRQTQAWSEPFDLDAFLNDPEPKTFNPDELVQIDLTDEEWEAFNQAIREGREA